MLPHKIVVKKLYDKKCDPRITLSSDCYMVASPNYICSLLAEKVGLRFEPFMSRCLIISQVDKR